MEKKTRQSAVYHLNKRGYEMRAFFLGAFAKFRKDTVSFIVSVCLSWWNNSAPTGRIIIKFYIPFFFENLLRKAKFH